MAHVVQAAAVGRHDLQNLVESSRAEIRTRRAVGRVVPRARRHVREVAAQHVERSFVVGRHVVDDPRHHRNLRPAELFLGDVLADGRLHQRWPGSEDRAVRGHDREIGHRRGERAVPGRGTEHRGHERYVARQLRLRDQIARCASVDGVAGHRRPMARPLEDHHQRDALLPRELRDAIALRGVARTDRATEHREVLGAYEHRASVDATPPGDEPVGGHGADQRSDLAERTGVEQIVDAFAHGERPTPMVLRDLLGPSHDLRRGATPGEVGEAGPPVVRQFFRG